MNNKYINNFNLDSFKVLLGSAYMNIMTSDSNLSKIEDFLTSDENLLSEEMSSSKMTELYRAITQRQKNNIQLLTQLISISNRNEQIKLLLAELTKIKEITNKENDVPELSSKTQAALIGIRKLMQEEYEKERGINKKSAEDTDEV